VISYRRENITSPVAECRMECTVPSLKVRLDNCVIPWKWWWL